MMATDRTIDDPGLNQDSTFDKKDEENFDEADEYHKFDDTSKDESKKNQDDEKGLSDGNIDR
jgi:hypothetical protein